MTKSILALCLLGLCTSLLAGCGSNESQAEDWCDRELCQESNLLQDECIELVLVCLEEDKGDDDECKALAAEKCDGG